MAFERGGQQMIGSRRVREIMNSPVATVSPSATVEDAARLMVDRRVASVVVVSEADPQTPVGIVTETDFEIADDPIPFAFFRWPAAFGWFARSEESLEQLYESARTRSIESVMSAPVISVEADAGIWQAVELMIANELKRLPVLEDGRLVGIVARHDLLKCMLDEYAEPLPDS